MDRYRGGTVTTASASIPATPEAPSRSIFTVLRHRDFAVFWSSALVSSTGNWMQSATVPFVLYGLTGSTTWLGVSAFLAFFPALLVGPVAGSLADRVSRRRVIIIAQSVMMVVAFSLWGFWVSGNATPAIIVVHLCVSGVAAGLSIASWQAFVPQLVPTADLVNAVRLNSMQFMAARAFGPALAGLALAVFGPGTTFLANALSFVVVIVAVIAVNPARVTPDRTGSVRSHFRDGLAYVRSRPPLVLAIVTIASLAFFGSGAIQLAPAFASEEFDVGAAAYGVLLAAFGVGAMFGSAIVAIVRDRVARSRMAMIGTFLYASGVLVLGGAPIYIIGIVGLFVMGVAHLLAAVSLNTSIQARVAESHRGRVISLYLMGLMAGVPFGALVQGKLASLIGLRATVVGAGLALFGFATFAIVHWNGMRPLDESIADEPDALGEPEAVPGAE
jgi:MFS family permease